MENSNKTPNRFVRTLIILFCIVLAAMIFFNYLLVEPKGDINKGLLVLLSILLILVLSESFDSFSLGKLITISREVKKKGVQVKDLERKNSELLKQLITISSTQTQTQQHTIVSGDYNESSQRASEQETEPEVDKEEIEKLLAVVGDSIVISELVDRIKAEMEEKGLSTHGDSVKILIKHLAGTRLLLTFEQIHSLIFGSQIRLLKKLNESTGIGKATDFVHTYIDIAKSTHADNLSSWDYNQYLSYLYSSLLIVDDDNNNIHITELGVEYLTWIIRDGRREDSPL
ncbi:MAG: hypothetical protein HON76_20505 [Candidatus Scalindua sp.]|nr:hypothetical protein [Candidatus Scalindua sp.]MBT6564903.1 hypothetical protein [Candidatus Scalindua sp.]MBT7591748.1 hypothetical protein [Candidatus Scalindua sp.]